MPDARAGADTRGVGGLHRLTQPDWCNEPQPNNWSNACMRAPGHDGDHAVRKSYRWAEAWFWPASGTPVRYGPADRYPDLYPVESADATSEQTTSVSDDTLGPPVGTNTTRTHAPHHTTEVQPT